MCLLAILYRVAEDVPLIIGANREEYYQRGGEPPRILNHPLAVAGIDPVAGGTWLGVNRDGVVIAVTNRDRTSSPVNPRSRGLLARELLAHHRAVDAVKHAVGKLESNRYAGCNYLCADGENAFVIQAGDWLRVRPLPPGVHVVSNRDCDDPTDGRVVHALRWFAGRNSLRARDYVEPLQWLCSSSEPAGEPICSREPDRGVVSSTILLIPSNLGQGMLLHAQGAPDRTDYADLSHLLRELQGH